MTLAVSLEIDGRKRPWPNDAHIPFQDTPEIKELIKRGLSYESAPFGNSLFSGEQFAFCIALVSHIAKLQDGKGLAMSPDPRLFEEERSSHIEEGNDRDHEVDRQGDQASNRRDPNINKAFAILGIEIGCWSYLLLKSIHMIEPIFSKLLPDRSDLIGC